MAKYEFNGDKYKKASRHQKEWGIALINELNLYGCESVLDLGCGDGILTGKIAKELKHGKVLGIDSSGGMIKTAKKLESDNLRFIRMDINEFNFCNEFDIIVSNATLHWVKDHKGLLKRSHSALTKGGMIRFNFAGDGNCSNFFDVVNRVMHENDFKHYFINFEIPWFMPGINEYKNIMLESPFKDYEVWGENKDRYFSNKEEMIKWIDQPSIVPFLNEINDKCIKKKFRDMVVDRMIKKTMGTDGKCFETFRRINVYAKKES